MTCPNSHDILLCALENHKYRDIAAGMPGLYSKKLKPTWRGIFPIRFVSLICLDQSWMEQKVPEGHSITVSTPSPHSPAASEFKMLGRTAEFLSYTIPEARAQA